MNQEPLALAAVAALAALADIIARQPATHTASYLHNLREAEGAAAGNPQLQFVMKMMREAAEKVARRD